jgi:hypothetical protein
VLDETELPEWASLIRDAQHWRASWREEVVDHETTFPVTVAFVRDFISRIVSE